MNNFGAVSQIVITLAAVVVVIAGMKAATAILVPFLLAVFIAVISAPTLFWLQHRGIPTFFALIIVISAVVVVGLFVTDVVGNSLRSFSQALPDYQRRLQGELVAFAAWLEDRGVDVPEKPLLQTFNPGAAMRLVNNLLSGLGSVLANAFLILFTTIFILLEASTFPRKLRAMAADPGASFTPLYAMIASVKRYMAIKVGISLFTGAAIVLWLAILGVDYPLLWGLLAFLLNFVPSIGSIIAAVPAVLLALIQLGFGSALMVALGYLAVNFVVGSLVEPKVMGRGVGLSALVVFLSLVFWGWVLGPVGMLLSVPLTMTVKIALDSHPDTRWIATLLGSEANAAVTEGIEERANAPPQAVSPPGGEDVS